MEGWLAQINIDTGIDNIDTDNMIKGKADACMSAQCCRMSSPHHRAFQIERERACLADRAAWEHAAGDDADEVGLAWGRFAFRDWLECLLHGSPLYKG